MVPTFQVAGLAGLLFVSSCATLPPEAREVVRTVEVVRKVELVRTVEVKVPQLPPLHPLLDSRTELGLGNYKLTDFERKVIREIFGPPVARWVERHVRVARESEFSGSTANSLAYYKPDTDWILLRKDPNTADSRRFANLIHEVTHYWEFHQYKHPTIVNYAKYSNEQIYRIPDEWKNLNIEQEAEIVSLYAVLTYLFTRDDQRWEQFGTYYTRADLPRIEDYMRREMYF